LFLREFFSYSYQPVIASPEQSEGYGNLEPVIIRTIFHRFCAFFHE